MSFRRLLGVAAATCVVSLCTPGVLAQAPALPYHATKSFDHWTFEPILVSGEVIGFVAYADAGTTVGHNIPMVWYEKVADGSWQMWGWSSNNLGVMVKWLREEVYGQPNILDKSSDLCCVITPTTPVLPPTSMSSGLFLDDPMQQLVTAAANPGEVMTLLEVIGWEAAPTLSTLAVIDVELCPETAETVAIDQVLNETAYTMELLLTGAVATPVDCFTGCTGCVRVYDPPVPTPGGSWTLKSTGTPSTHPDSKFCYWSFPATETWTNTGQKTNCDACTGGGSRTVEITRQTTVGRNEDCVTPPANP